MRKYICNFISLFILGMVLLFSCKIETVPVIDKESKYVTIHPVITVNNNEPSARTMGLYEGEIELDSITNVYFIVDGVSYGYETIEEFNSAVINVVEGEHTFAFRAKYNDLSLYGETVYTVESGRENIISINVEPEYIEKDISLSIKFSFPTESGANLSYGELYYYDSKGEKYVWNTYSDLRVTDNEDGTSSVILEASVWYSSNRSNFYLDLQFEDKDHNIYVYRETIVPQKSEIVEEFTIPKFFKGYKVTYDYGEIPEGVTSYSVKNESYYAVTFGIPLLSSTDNAYIIEWYFDKEFTQPVSGNPAEYSGDVTIYAKWTAKNKYTITVLDEDGNEVASGLFIEGYYKLSEDSPSIKIRVNENWDTEIKVSKEGYIVEDLYSDASFTQKLDSDKKYQLNSDTILYAKLIEAVVVQIYYSGTEILSNSFVIGKGIGYFYIDYIEGFIWRFPLGNRGSGDGMYSRGVYFDEECTQFVEDQKKYYPEENTILYLQYMEPETYSITLYDEDDTVLLEDKLTTNCYRYNFEDNTLQYCVWWYGGEDYDLPIRDYTYDIYTDSEHTQKVTPNKTIFVDGNVSLYIYSEAANYPEAAKEYSFECTYPEKAQWGPAQFAVEEDWKDFEIEFDEVPDASIFMYSFTSDIVEEHFDWGDLYYTAYHSLDKYTKVTLADFVEQLSEYNATKILYINLSNKTTEAQSLKVQYARVTKTDGSVEYVYPKSTWGCTVTTTPADEYNITEITQYASLVNSLVYENEMAAFCWDLLEIAGIGQSDMSGAGYIWKKKLSMPFPTYVNAVIDSYPKSEDKGNSGDDSVFEEEDSFTAVKNFKAGWNLSNTLDSHSYLPGNDANGWIPKKVQNPTPKTWETAWGQPEASQELADYVLGAGFNSIRVPVTWAEHLDENNNVDEVWMARVKEVVDYFYNRGAYVIVNVHHDGGENGWIKASKDSWDNYNGRFEKLWNQIAETFKDYDERLVFESMNEVLDANKSWSNPDSDAQSYINKYNQLFVDTVRATSGNNEKRNLVVMTYAGAGYFDGFAIPNDSVENHIIMEVHDYNPTPFCWSEENVTWTKCTALWNGSINVEQTIRDNIASYKANADRLGVPVIIGEYNASPKKYSDYDN